MKLLLDSHIGKLITDWLVGLGHDIVHARQFPPRTSDEQILTTAASEGRILMTADKDFGELIFRMNQPAAGVILLRIAVAGEQKRLAVIQGFWPQIEPAAKSHFLVVTAKSVRRLPLP